MVRLLALVLTLGALAPGRADADGACPSIDRAEVRPVYVILFGYPQGRGPEQASLRMVDHDLLHMARFFEALGPSEMWIHGEPEGSLLARFGLHGLRPATWRALLGTVDKLVERMGQDEARPQAYLYSSGHGNEGGGRVTLYARPERGADEPGYNGRLDSKLIADELLGPLSANADVHLLADTCFSYFLLQTKRMTQISRAKLDTADIVFDGAFARDFPGVGALLATRGPDVTYENGWHGGMFSHALRSAAFGPGDLNGDGVVTYGEMDFALAWISEGSPQFRRPAIVAPKLEHDRVFIDWRGSPAARVCASEHGRRFVLDSGSLFATVYLPGDGTPLWLKRDHPFALSADPELAVQQGFVARDGPLEIDANAPTPEIRGGAFGDFFPVAIDAAGYDPTRPAVDDGLPLQLAASATLGLSFTGGDGFWPGAAAGIPHFDLGGRLGYHRHRLLIEGSYTRWRVIEVGRDDAGTEPAHLSTNALGWRAGYGLLVHEGEWEVEVGTLGGFHWMWTIGGTEPFTTPEAALRVAVLDPWGPSEPLAWRFEGQVGLMRLDEWKWPTVRFGFGIDFETLVR